MTIGAHSRVLHGTVLNADLGPITLGSDVLVMEQALLRGRADHPLRVGDAVLVGPHTHLNGTTVEDEVFIATGASMFPGSRAGQGCELWAVQEPLDFPGTVYGVARGTSMREIIRRQCAAYGPSAGQP